MDFGDILNKWEKQRPGIAKGGSADDTAGAGPSGDPSPGKKTNPMDAWLRTTEVYDKDAADSGRQHSAQEKRRRLRNKKPEAQLDIHGQTRDEAWLSLETFFAEARGKGLEKILLIHGKGNHSTGEAVLKRTVMEFIERCPYAGESGRGKASAGGEGATWVLLKETEKRES
ncbi:MAG: Smr/MutS family protein [Treponema sp.]|jgi:DNA-nicking Smr family endonuclease|nr:Smr/MutS family protein [Treponema sp.]